jgi:tetratricopeptide (TPR) repeat protein
MEWDSGAADLARAETLVDRVLAASRRYAFAHHIKGHVLLALRRWEEAILEYEAALALNHNLAPTLHGLGLCKLYAGSIGEVIPLMEQAIRLSPRDPRIGGHCYDLIGMAHLLQSQTDEAIVWLEKARSAMPGVPIFHSHLASVRALRGETDRAAAELDKARRLSSGDLLSSIAKIKADLGRTLSPKTRALCEATYFAGLRKARMPEE